MDRRPMIEQEVRATLEQLEVKKRLTPSPFFFAQIQARLEKHRSARGRLRMAGLLKPALLLLLVACNIVTAALVLESGRSKGVDRAAILSAVGGELGLAASDTDLFPGQ